MSTCFRIYTLILINHSIMASQRDHPLMTSHRHRLLGKVWSFRLPFYIITGYINIRFRQEKETHLSRKLNDIARVKRYYIQLLIDAFNVYGIPIFIEYQRCALLKKSMIAWGLGGGWFRSFLWYIFQYHPVGYKGSRLCKQYFSYPCLTILAILYYNFTK